MRPQHLDRLALTASSIALQQRYWLRVFPHVRREQQRWRRRAAAIPGSALRGAALDALRLKRGNPQGAAIFAVVAPRHQRSRLARALVVFQTMYDYVDTLSECRGATSPANVRQLHLALVDGVAKPVAVAEYYALHVACDDGGYLDDLVSACRETAMNLPSYALVAHRVHHFARLLVDYQALIGAAPRRPDAAIAWAQPYSDVYGDMEWWEIVAAAGSSLPVFALLAAAADTATTPADVVAIERAYFPAIAVLHSLMDGLVDRTEDALAGHQNLMTHYASGQVAADRLFQLASRALEQARTLPSGQLHIAILCAMASYYLAAPEASLPESRQARKRILSALRGPIAPGMALFGIKHLARRFTRRFQWKTTERYP